MNKEFEWLMDSQYTRSGAFLEKGKSYAAASFPAHVVEEWVKSGAAKYVAVAKAKRSNGD